MTSPRRGSSLPLPALGAAAQIPGTRQAPDLEPRPRGRLRAIVATARPRQWVKNALVVAAPGAAGALGHDDVPGRVALACIAFCLISAWDLRDQRRPRRRRGPPPPAQALSPGRRRRARTAGRDSDRHRAGWSTGLVMCVSIRPLLGLVGARIHRDHGQLHARAAQASCVLDIVAIAGGFVLRALAGGVAAPVDAVALVRAGRDRVGRCSSPPASARPS